MKSGIGVKQILERATQRSGDAQRRGKADLGGPTIEVEERLLAALGYKSFKDLAQSYDAITRSAVTGGPMHSTRLMEGASAALTRLQQRTFDAKQALRRAIEGRSGAEGDVEKCRAVADRLEVQEQTAVSLFPLVRRRELSVAIEDCRDMIDSGRKQILDLQRRLQRERREMWRTRLERDLQASEERTSRALLWSQEYDERLRRWYEQYPELAAELGIHPVEQRG